jgi:hypothetical protein
MNESNESQMDIFPMQNEKEKEKEEYFCVYIRYSTPILSSDQTTNNNKPEAVVVQQRSQQVYLLTVWRRLLL